jgi:dienelactone hydrolase
MALPHHLLRRWKALLAVVAAISCLSGLVGWSAHGSYWTAAVPAPLGPNKVGTLMMWWVDRQRNDPYLADGTKRELMVRFWYPAFSGHVCKTAAYTSPKVWNYFSQLVGIPLPEVRTNSCQDSPISDGAHPVIVFTHGYTGTFTDYTFISEDLASRGYVVASVAHTYETTAVEFPDGRLVKSVFGSHLDGNTLRIDDQALSFALSVRSWDLKFVLDELERLNTRSDSPFVGKLDISRIGLAGHSLGGVATLLGIEQEPRLKVGVILDGDVTDDSIRGTDKPVLIVAAGRDQWSDYECQLWSNLRGPRFAVNLRGAEHLTPSDAVWLLKDVPGSAVRTGAMGPEKTIAAVRNYIAAFFDTNLLGKPKSVLLNGHSSHYPDAVVKIQEQALCNHP